VKFLVLSDLHANWWALESVLKDAENRYDQILCCGDVVGYNPRPREVLQWTKQNCAVVIRGNHDKVVAGLEDLDWFNEVAQAAAIWTANQLTPDERAYVRDLAKGPVPVHSFQLCHGSPLLPAVEKSMSERVLEIQPDISYLINPGSVGQPRDGDPRAAYVIYDSEKRTVAYRRVEYPVEETAREIKGAGLPDVLAYRLFRGL
jgi:predicted phosphodiesterase